jgi:hypothetical protein
MEDPEALAARRAAQLAAIEATFAAAREPPVHPTRPNLRPVEVMECELITQSVVVPTRLYLGYQMWPASVYEDTEVLQLGMLPYITILYAICVSVQPSGLQLHLPCSVRTPSLIN